MQVVKALIGGLIGGGVGAYLANLGSSSESLGSAAVWLFLIAGVLAGLGVRLICGADRSFLTGLIAAVTTVIAIMGASYATSVSEKNKVAETMKSAVMPAIDMGDPGSAEDPLAVEDEAAPESADESAEPAGETEPAADLAAAEEVEPAAESAQDRPGDPTPRGAEERIDAVMDAETANVPFGGWVPMDFVINGISALIAFAIGSGTANQAGRKNA